LCRSKTYQFFDSNGPAENYQAFVEQGNDDLTNDFYSKKAMRSIFGSDTFVESHMKTVDENREIPSIVTNQFIDIEISELTHLAARHFNMTITELKTCKKGKQKINMGRYLAIYSARNFCGFDIATIANHFGFRNKSSVSRINSQTRRWLEFDPGLQTQLDLFLNNIKGI
jgi:chromosomal replication initiation ATPase DnaA